MADINTCTRADKKEAFTSLYLKVKASPQTCEIKGYVDFNLITTGQT
ncbi:hypothetical protein DGWBC_0612 [Dehalogenimonas sp. WBC-2]|nr:hypothetical protein DGWBC_0612 [Dehalogenimonas sp. WBC-2]